MKVGDLVRVTWMNPTSRDPSTGVIIEFKRFNTSEFARVFLTNGHIATYRTSNLEVVSCK